MLYFQNFWFIESMRVLVNIILTSYLTLIYLLNIEACYISLTIFTLKWDILLFFTTSKCLAWSSKPLLRYSSLGYLFCLKLYYFLLKMNSGWEQLVVFRVWFFIAFFLIAILLCILWMVGWFFFVCALTIFENTSLWVIALFSAYPILTCWHQALEL